MSMFQGGARNFFQHRHHLFRKVRVDYMESPCLCVSGIETLKGTLEEWLGAGGGGEWMTRVCQNVIECFLLRGNIDFGSLFGFWFDRRIISFGCLHFLATS